MSYELPTISVLTAVTSSHGFHNSVGSCQMTYKTFFKSSKYSLSNLKETAHLLKPTLI